MRAQEEQLNDSLTAALAALHDAGDHDDLDDRSDPDDLHGFDDLDGSDDGVIFIPAATHDESTEPYPTDRPDGDGQAPWGGTGGGDRLAAVLAPFRAMVEQEPMAVELPSPVADDQVARDGEPPSWDVLPGGSSTGRPRLARLVPRPSSDSRLLHLVRFVGLTAMVVASSGLLVGLVWAPTLLSHTGRRKRDALLTLVPGVGVVVWAQTLWRCTATRVYWRTRDDRGSRVMESSNVPMAGCAALVVAAVAVTSGAVTMPSMRSEARAEVLSAVMSRVESTVARATGGDVLAPPEEIVATPPEGFVDVDPAAPGPHGVYDLEGWVATRTAVDPSVERAELESFGFRRAAGTSWAAVDAMPGTYVTLRYEMVDLRDGAAAAQYSELRRLRDGAVAGRAAFEVVDVPGAGGVASLDVVGVTSTFAKRYYWAKGDRAYHAVVTSDADVPLEVAGSMVALVDLRG